MESAWSSRGTSLGSSDPQLQRFMEAEVQKQRGRFRGAEAERQRLVDLYEFKLNLVYVMNSRLELHS